MMLRLFNGLLARIQAHFEKVRPPQSNRLDVTADGVAMTLLYEVGNHCVQADKTIESCLDAILQAGVLLMGADKGNFQLLNAQSRTLRIAAQHNFETPFLAFFAEIQADEASVCSAVMQTKARIVVENIARSPLFQGQESQAILLAAGVQAVQSTPLLSSTGTLLGMISTYFARPHRPAARELRLMDLLARQASDYLERKQSEQDIQAGENWQHGKREALGAALNNAPLQTSLGILSRSIANRLGQDTRVAFYIVQSEALYHVVGMPTDYAKAVDGFKIGLDSLTCGLAIYRGQPVITPDVTQDTRWQPWLWLAEHFDYRGCWSFPIQNSEELFGTLAIYWTKPRVPVPFELELISNLTSTAAIIYAHHRESEARRQTEAALIRMGNQLTEGQRIAHLGSWEYIKATQTTLWSDEQKRIYGLEPSQPSPDYAVMLRQYIHPADAPQLDRKFRTAMANYAPFENENRIIRPDGKIRWIHNKARPYFDKNGNLLNYIGTTLDITESKQDELRRSFLLQLNDAMRPLADASAIQSIVTHKAMTYFEADRCYYCEIEADQAIIRRDASRQDLPSVMGTYRLADLPLFKAVIEAGHPLIIEDANTSEIMDEALKQLCIQMKIISYLDVPVIKEGKPVGILCITQCKPRNWTDSEAELAVEIAERTWAAVERTRNEQALRASETKYRTLFESIDEGFCIIELIYDNQKKVVDWLYRETNKSFEQQTVLENPAGKRRSELFLQTEQYWLDIYEKVARTGESVRFENYHQDTQRWYHVYASRIDGPGSALLTIVFNEITERKYLEERQTFLLKLSDTLRPLNDAVHIQAQACRLLGEYLHADRVYYAEINETEGWARVAHNYLRGDSPPVLGEFNLTDYHWVISRLRCGESVVATDAQTLDDIPAAGRVALATLNVRAYVSLPLIKTGALVGALCITEPEPRTWHSNEIELISETAERIWAAAERAQVEIALREADRRKDEFLATLAHELRNPLAPISNGLHILKRLGLDNQTFENVRVMMERQVNHMVILVNDLMEVSRITRGKIELHKETVDLSTVLLNAVETSRPLIDKAQHQLEINLSAKPLILHADKIRLAQIITNILNNAAKYTPPGGQIWLNAKRKGLYAVVTIKDNGIGISAEMLPKVFDLFTQANLDTDHSRGGLGIGLTLAQSLVKLHGGHIEVSSPGPNKGSEFVVSLPLIEAHSDLDNSIKNAGQPLSLGAQRILVVDDNLDSANSLTLLLKQMEAEVITVNDGMTALETLKTFHPSVVLLDIGMPQMDGYEVAQRIRQLPEGQAITLIALTGWGQEEDRRKTEAVGFNYHLVKPAELSVLHELLTNVPPKAPSFR